MSEVYNSEVSRDFEKHIALCNAICKLEEYPSKIENLLIRITNGTESLTSSCDASGNKEDIECEPPITLSAILIHSPSRILKTMEKMDDLLNKIHGELF